MLRMVAISLLIVLAEMLTLAAWFPQSLSSTHNPLQFHLNIQSL